MIKSNYIYQTIHTLSHHPLYVAEHCRLLEFIFLEIFLRPLKLDERDVYNRIVELLRERGVTQEVSVFVELRIDIDQQCEFIISETSIYEGYVMRSISPSIHCITMDSPFGLFPTSARREALCFADELAQNFGADLAIECSREGVALSLAGATLFAITNGYLVATPSVRSIERELVIKAAKAEGLRIDEGIILRSELNDMEELFGCDHRGITSIARHAEHRFFSFKTKKIAQTMAQPW